VTSAVRAALYLRVSTRDQSVENQERELRRWAERLGFNVVRVCAETASGARSDRAALAEVLAGAHRREFDVILIWSLDRFSREGILPMVRYFEQLRLASVRVMSHQEPWVDTGGPVGDLLLAVFAWVAQQERQRIGERVRAGQARARAEGVRLGRKTRVVDLQELQVRRAQGQGWRRIARAMRVPTTTLRRRWKECQNSPYELRTPSSRLAGNPEAAEGKPPEGVARFP
jgi:DNA invertase Pin-like site-specific DNA recombinase